MPKLDPDDVDQPTATDVAAAAQANAVNPATTTSAPATATASKAAPSFFGGSNATTNISPGGASAFGASSTTGFGSTSGGFGSSAGAYGSGGSSFGGTSGGFGGGQPQQQIAADANTTAAFGNLMAASAGREPEHWMKSFWRPAMGWLYMLICFMDFVAFPLISMFLPIIERGFGLQMGYVAWQSLTLSNGGLIHLAFGGILGVSAFGRTQEKKAGVNELEKK